MSFHKNTFYNKSKTAVKQNRRKIKYIYIILNIYPSRVED